MNKLLFSVYFFLFIFPIIICSFPSPSLVKRAFTSCDGTFPITFTTYTITPDPVVLGESATTNIEGTNTETIEAGTLLQFIASFQGTEKNNTTVDFCKTLELTCPYAAGTFTYTKTEVIPADPSVPKGQTITVDMIINVLKPDGTTIIGCEQGSLSFTA